MVFHNPKVIQIEAVKQGDSIGTIQGNSIVGKAVSFRNDPVLINYIWTFNRFTGSMVVIRRKNLKDVDAVKTANKEKVITVV